MPATPNYRLPDWHEHPALTSSHELTVPEAEVYVSSREECARFVLAQALPEITAYDGYPELQEEMAFEVADKVFDPEKDVAQALHRYLTTQQQEDAEPSATEQIAAVIPIETRYVATRYDVQTGKMLPFAHKG